MNKVKCLIYCTKDKNNQLYRYYGNKYDVLESKQDTMPQPDFFMNGKIVAQFDCEKVEKFDVPYPAYFWEVKDKLEHITKCSCLSLMNLHHYLGNENGYALHLSNVKVFDEPKELSDYLICNDDKTNLEKWKQNQYAPQNMKNVYESCSIFSYFLSKILLKKYVLISIRPEHLCKILNGEKTIEVRKKILNSLKEEKEECQK